jgi:segregation and condensation protein B
VDQVRKVVRTADGKAVREAFGSLSADYDQRGGGFFLAEVAGGFQLRTRPEYNEYIKDLLQPNPPRLSKAALETLAIIAYKQPIIRADLEHLRGVDSGGVLRLLLKRKLIRVLGRKEIPGRPLIYATTKRFLEMFDLKDLKDLPTPREIEELGSEASDELAAAFEALSLPEEGPVQPQQEPGLFDTLSEPGEAPGADAAETEAEPAETTPRQAEEETPGKGPKPDARAAASGAEASGSVEGEPPEGAEAPQAPEEEKAGQSTEITEDTEDIGAEHEADDEGENAAGEDATDWDNRF